MTDSATQQNSHKSLSANMVTFIFIVNFIVIAGLIAIINSPAAEQAAAEQATPEPTQVAALVESETPVAAPSETLQAVAEPATMTAIPPTAVTEDQASTSDTQVNVGAGEMIFSRTCAACHGFAAQGVSGLGPGMINSPFVDGLSDAELVAFLQVGRPIGHPDNTTGITMPALGGNPSLTEPDLINLVAYIRSLNTEADPSLVQVAPPAASEPREAAVFTPLTLSGLVPPRESTDSLRPAEDPFFTSVADRYNSSCAGCHGINGEGLSLLAAPLSESPLMTSRNGIALFDLLTHAVPPADPRTGMTHPYRGGYPPVTDEEALQIIAYMYSLLDQSQ